jgi:hypothetical protein
MGAKMFESILDGTSAKKKLVFDRWVDRLDQQLNTALVRSSSSAELQIHLTSLLEIRFVTFNVNDH